GFGVACMEEALELREAGIEAPIVLLEGFFDAGELDLVERHRLWTVVASPWQVDLLERHRARQPWQVWLKLDSGMHRLGLSPEEFVPAWRRLAALPWVGQMVAMTHFSRADELSHPSTPGQMAVFESVLASLPPGTPASVANSAALMAWPATRREWVRPGLMLYGAHMPAAPSAPAAELRAVLTLESKVIAVRDLAAGEPTGYAGPYTPTRPPPVGQAHHRPHRPAGSRARQPRGTVGAEPAGGGSGRAQRQQPLPPARRPQAGAAPLRVTGRRRVRSATPPAASSRRRWAGGCWRW